MKVFRDLFLRGDPEQLAALIDEIAGKLDDGWSRDEEAERNLRTLALRGEPTYCFACEPREQRRAVLVFITAKEPGVWYVPNIVPRGHDALSYEQYNAILTEFHDRFLRPAAERTGVAIVLTNSEKDLEEWLSPGAATKLRAFSAGANRSTGSSHPIDQQRWIDFIVTAFRDGSRLDAEMLLRWLTEAENWTPEVAERLASEYEFGREMLAFSEGRRRSA